MGLADKIALLSGVLIDDSEFPLANMKTLTPFE